jgi:crotonobetainyl-CoA:carnitine CoA-transferase CaiB-like acyl-CoA transferase
VPADHRPATAKVLDVSMDISGQYAARLLSRHGFDVTRAQLTHPAAQPSMIADGAGIGPGTPLDHFLNRAKRLVRVDLGSSEGGDELDRLVRSHDIVISTFLPSAAAALGLDPAGIRAGSAPTRLVSITPYGSFGARASQRATEKTLFAHAGAMFVTGDPARPPFCPNIPIASMLGGIYGAMGVVLGGMGAGVGPRDGFEIDIALMDVLAANLERVLAWYTHLEAVPLRGVGSGRPEQSAGGGSMRAADGYFYVFSGYQWFDRVAEMVGRPDLKRTSQPSDPHARQDLADSINTAVAEAISTLSVSELARRAQRLRMPSGPVNTVATLPSDPQLVWRETFSKADDGDLEIDEPFRIQSGPGPRTSKIPGVGWPEARSLPLTGVKVLDLSHAFAGPTSARLLAEAGADVLKIESTNRLDLLARGMLPLDNDTGGEWWERSGYFADRNLGKRGITLDMSTETGRGLFLDLVVDADVIVTNFTPRVLREWGLGPDVLLGANPLLVVLLMSGFGQHGPKSDNPALAGTMEAASGFSSLVRPDDALPPGALGFNFGDMVSGVYGALGVLLALHRRSEEGVGQIIDFACAEAPLAFLAPQILSCWIDQVDPSVGADSLHDGIHVLIRADGESDREGWVLSYVPVADEATFKEILHNGRLGVADDGSPDSGAVPHQVRSRLSRQELLETLHGLRFCAAPLSDAEDLWFDPALRERALYIFATRRSVGTLPYARALPLWWSGTPLEASRRSVPTLGEDNWAVFGEGLGIEPEAFAQLEQEGILGSRPTGRLPKTFEVPLALQELETLELIRPVAGARKRLIASFAHSDRHAANGGNGSAE